MMTDDLKVAGRTRKEWFDHACRDDCFDSMVPSDLRQLVNAAWNTRPTPEPQQPVGVGMPAAIWAGETDHEWWMDYRAYDNQHNDCAQYTRSDLVTAMQHRHAEELERAVKEAREVALGEAADACDMRSGLLEEFDDSDGVAAACLCAADISALKGKTDGNA